MNDNNPERRIPEDLVPLYNIVGEEKYKLIIKEMGGGLYYIPTKDELDIAERDTINRFTTVPLTINMTNNNNIDSETDIDGIVDSLTKRLEEELEYISDGVHE